MGMNLAAAIIAKDPVPEDIGCLEFQGLGGVYRIYRETWEGRQVWVPKSDEELTDSNDDSASCFCRDHYLHDFLIPNDLWDYSVDPKGVQYTDHWRGNMEEPMLIREFMAWFSSHEGYDWWPARLLLEYDYSAVTNHYNGVRGQMRDLFPKWYFELLDAARRINAEYIIFTR